MSAKRRYICFDVLVCFFELKEFFIVLIIAALLAAPHRMPAAENINATEAFEERNRLVDLARDEGPEALPELQDAISSEKDIVRYTAARLLVRLGEPGREALSSNLAHEDLQVRYVFVEGLNVQLQYFGGDLL